MAPKVIDDLRQAIEEQGGAPVYVVDAATQDQYVLLRAEQYEKLKAVVDEDVEGLYPLLADIEPDDWEDASAYGITKP